MSICVIGAANADVLTQTQVPSQATVRDSHIGDIRITFGGVARNIAENLARLSVPTIFVSVLAKDNLGHMILKHMQKLKDIDCSHMLLLDDAHTSCYNVIHNTAGEMLYAVSDMQIVDRLNPEYFATKRQLILKSSLCLLDVNLSQESLDYITSITGPRYIIDTVSGTKAHKLHNIVHKIYLLKTNIVELAALMKRINKQYYHSAIALIKQIQDNEDIASEQHEHVFSSLFSLFYEMGALLIAKGLRCLVVSLGNKGLWYMEHDNDKKLIYRHVYLDSEKQSTLRIQSTTGAGDALCAGLLYALYNGGTLYNALRYGIAAATHTVQDVNTVSTSMSKEVLEMYYNEIKST